MDMLWISWQYPWRYPEISRWYPSISQIDIQKISKRYQNVWISLDIFRYPWISLDIPMGRTPRCMHWNGSSIYESSIGYQQLYLQKIRTGWRIQFLVKLIAKHAKNLQTIFKWKSFIDFKRLPQLVVEVIVMSEILRWWSELWCAKDNWIGRDILETIKKSENNP